MTTLRAQNTAIMPTAAAKAAGQANAVTLTNLQLLLDQHLVDAAILLKQIIAIHPTTAGTDATNLAALQAILTAIT